MKVVSLFHLLGSTSAVFGEVTQSLKPRLSVVRLDRQDSVGPNQVDQW